MSAKVVGMGNAVDHEPLDPGGDRAYVLLEVSKENARKLAPSLLQSVGFQVVLRESLCDT